MRSKGRGGAGEIEGKLRTSSIERKEIYQDMDETQNQDYIKNLKYAECRSGRGIYRAK